MRRSRSSLMRKDPLLIADNRTWEEITTTLGSTTTSMMPLHFDCLHPSWDQTRLSGHPRFEFCPSGVSLSLASIRLLRFQECIHPRLPHQWSFEPRFFSIGSIGIPQTNIFPDGMRLSALEVINDSTVGCGL
jgi:hypothetical protein